MLLESNPSIEGSNSPATIRVTQNASKGTNLSAISHQLEVHFVRSAAVRAPPSDESAIPSPQSPEQAPFLLICEGMSAPEGVRLSVYVQRCP